MLAAFSNPAIAVDSDSAVFEFYAHKKSNNGNNTYSITYKNLYDPADSVIVDGKEFVVSLDDLKTDNYVKLYEVIYETNHLQNASTEIVFTLYPFNEVNSDGVYIDSFYKTGFDFSLEYNGKDVTEIYFKEDEEAKNPVVNSSYTKRPDGQKKTIIIKWQNFDGDGNLEGTLSVKIIVSAKIIDDEHASSSGLYKMPVKITVSGG